MTRDETCGVFIPEGMWWEWGGANGRESDRRGWVESQISCGRVRHIQVRVGSLLCTGWLSAFLEFM